MRFILSGLMLAAFAVSPVRAQDVIVGVYRVDAIGGAPPARQFTMRFSPQGRLSGKACNNFGSNYHIEGDRLTIGEIMSTRMACREPLMSQEQRLFDILKSAERWRRNGRVLSIETTTGSGLTATTID
ncbi:MAG: META domain-containing protein [Methylocystis sp.]|nr:META domain-containing protein [Methylocystis sp.]